MTPLISFLMEDGKNNSGLRYTQILGQSDEEFESRHDQIQWLFPLPEPSEAVPGSPILTLDDFGTLRQSDYSIDRLIMSKHFMQGFYFRTDQWKRVQDHNHLRITRILKHLALFRGYAYAWDFYSSLMSFLMNQPIVINPRSINFWKQAISYGEDKESLPWK